MDPRTKATATTAAWGFLAGALFVCAIMWGYGDAVDSLASRFRRAPAAGAVDPLNAAIADADTPRRPGKSAGADTPRRPANPVATTGSMAKAQASASTTTTVTPHTQDKEKDKKENR